MYLQNRPLPHPRKVDIVHFLAGRPALHLVEAARIHVLELTVGGHDESAVTLDCRNDSDSDQKKKKQRRQGKEGGEKKTGGGMQALRFHNINSSCTHGQKRKSPTDHAIGMAHNNPCTRSDT